MAHELLAFDQLARGGLPASFRIGEGEECPMNSRNAAVAAGSQDRSELLDIVGLSLRIKISVGCIRSWRLRGEGPPAIRVGNSLRWDSREVDEWLDSRRESRHLGQ